MREIGTRGRRFNAAFVKIPNFALIKGGNACLVERGSFDTIEGTPLDGDIADIDALGIKLHFNECKDIFIYDVRPHPLPLPREGGIVKVRGPTPCPSRGRGVLFLNLLHVFMLLMLFSFLW